MRMLFLLLYLFFPVETFAEPYEIICRGVMNVGTSDSGTNGMEPSCGFATNSDIGRKVLSVCGDLDECEIKGIIEDDILISVSSVRNINTDIEPSVDVIKDAALWSLDIRDQTESGLLCIDSVHLSDFHSFTVYDETHWKFNFTIRGNKCGPDTPKELGSGTLTLVKRGQKWLYIK